MIFRQRPLGLKFIWILFAYNWTIDAQIIVTTIAGSGSATSVDGQDTLASIFNPQKLLGDRDGNIFVVDSYGGCIRKINSTYYMSTIAGRGFGSFVDDPPNFYWPWGLAMDLDGSLLVADSYHNMIRRVSKDGVVTNIAGSLLAGSLDGAVELASFDTPYALQVDSAGNIYVADTYNHIIRKISASGIVSTIIGIKETPGALDGQGTQATLHYPQGIIFDHDGNMYISDCFNHKIRKMNTSGYVSTYFGTGGMGSRDGPFTVGTLRYPRSMALDQAGNMFLVEDSNKVRRINSNRAVTTIAGNGTAGSADGVGSQATFDTPMGIYLDQHGVIYISDVFNHKVRKLTCETMFCGSGTFQNGCACVPCPAGYYQPEPLQGSCLPCPAGTFQPDLQSRDCIPCSVEMFQHQTGQAACEPCPTNSVCTANNYTCNPGFVKKNNRTCVSCGLLDFSEDGRCPTNATTSYSSFWLFFTVLILASISTMGCLFGFFCGFFYKDWKEYIGRLLMPHEEQYFTSSTRQSEFSSETQCSLESPSCSYYQSAKVTTQDQSLWEPSAMKQEHMND